MAAGPRGVDAPGSGQLCDQMFSAVRWGAVLGGDLEADMPAVFVSVNTARTRTKMIYAVPGLATAASRPPGQGPRPDATTSRRPGRAAHCDR